LQTEGSLGNKSKGHLWPKQTEDEDDADILEAFENQKHLRIGTDSEDLFSDPGSDSDGGETERDSEDESLVPALSSAAATVVENVGAAGALKGSESEFLQECRQTLQRGFSEGLSVDDLAIELKTTIRMSYNQPIRRVLEVAIQFLVERVPTESKNLSTEVNRLFGRWGDLIVAIGGTAGTEVISILQVRATL
jgi:hypothetical protein